MKATINESNARRNGEVLVNGYTVDLEGLSFVGSEKQIAWATSIIETETRVLVETYVAAKARKAGHAANILSTDEAGAWMAEINATLAAQVAPKLAGAPAHKIIDARNGGLPAILKAL